MTTQMKMNKLQRGLAVALAGMASIAMLLLLPMMAAAADDPAASQYGPDTPEISTLSNGGDTVGSLPFTGTDILLLAAAAIVLFGVAATLRHFGRRGETQ